MIGHTAHLEGCTVGDGFLIGSGSVVLNARDHKAGAGVGAGTIVAEGKTVPTGHIRARRARTGPSPAPELKAWVAEAVELYRELALRHGAQLRHLE